MKSKQTLEEKIEDVLFEFIRELGHNDSFPNGVDKLAALFRKELKDLERKITKAHGKDCNCAAEMDGECDCYLRIRELFRKRMRG